MLAFLFLLILLVFLKILCIQHRRGHERRGHEKLLSFSRQPQHGRSDWLCHTIRMHVFPPPTHASRLALLCVVWVSLVCETQVRSLTLMLEESKKEARWMKERNGEQERVVEALRKTIMRQAELSSQRQDHQQGDIFVRFSIYTLYLQPCPDLDLNSSCCLIRCLKRRFVR